jgi:hypothetical protein
MVIKIPNIPTRHRAILYGGGKTKMEVILNSQEPPNHEHVCDAELNVAVQIVRA